MGNLHKSVKNKEAFGIVELVVSLLILSIGITAVMALMSRIVIAGMRSEASIVSLNLAREGIEAVRNIRDSNWIAGRRWDTGFYNNTDYSGVIIFNPSSRHWEINFIADSVSDTNLTRLFYDELSHLYKHDSQYEKTPFSRLIETKPICHDDAQIEIIRNDNDTCLPTEEKVGIEVTSTVLWDGTGNTQTTVLVDKLYNWR